MSSDNLRRAKEKKNDEFYSRLEDLELEIAAHDDYCRQLKGKIVYCNCDDPEFSNFWQFFKLHFKKLGIQKVISTHINLDGNPSYKVEWEGEITESGEMVNLIKTPLKGNGDFRSEECVQILKDSDVVITNPPYSIAREFFIPLIIQYKKKFIMIGDLNWVAYKHVFPLFKEGRMFFGYTDVKAFFAPDGSIEKFGNKTWFTNFNLNKAHSPLVLTKTYKGNGSKYPKYDNYDAIECSKVKDIPKDYFPCWYDCPRASSCVYAQSEGKEDAALCEESCNGEMGVPITYMANHSDSQFKIIGMGSGDQAKALGVIPYTKLLSGPALERMKKLRPNYGALYITDGKGMPHLCYNRILIQRKLTKE